ncbi:MAG TPA: hypothetical protein VF618_06065 [Thermoanaerobaculia bacterium]
MIRRLAIAALALTLAACGGDSKFDLENPPKWLTGLKSAMPSNALAPADVQQDCFGRPFQHCTARVRQSKSFVRTAKVRLVDGSEVRMAYREVAVTIVPDGNGEIPVRGEGGVLTFDCIAPGAEGTCQVALGF